MAALDDLIQQISDPELRARIQKEADRLLRQKKFGLVFEEHIPECTPLWDIPIKRGSLVAPKGAKIQETYVVTAMSGETAECWSEVEKTTKALPVKDLVAVARFGQPIYPCLKLMDSVCNAPDSDLWHTLIEADNYHALQLLEYLYAGKVDCIYIDPPYNTGAKDWKYNNDYVDISDTYRHSKWLSMMQKRLKIAKKLLNPQDSVLIVTIDEKEYLHLGCLLEEMFPDARIQMVDSVINRKGVSHKGKKGTNIDREEIVQFSRVSEYIYFVMMGRASAAKTLCNMLDSQTNEKSKTNSEDGVQWLSMLRRGTAARRCDKAKHFYPIFVDQNTATIVSVGDPIPLEVDRNTVTPPSGTVAVWPLRTNGSEGRWQLKKETFWSFFQEGYAKLGSYNAKQNRWAINYLNEGIREEIVSGAIKICGKDEKGALVLKRENTKLVEPKSVWNQTLHNASEHGSTLINTVIGEKRFDFPKSLYAVHDAIRFFVANKPEALIVDFFAGSGTTLHAVNLLNAEDGGHRRCVMVTNNEVSADEAVSLSAQGFQPGDEEWERLGIARYVNWPRTKCSILGVDVNGNPISGDYITTCKKTVEGDRKIVQIALDGNTLSTEAKKNIISLLNSDIPQKALTANSNYILDEDYTTSIIFNLECEEEWLDALEEQTQVSKIYVVTNKKSAFNKLKAAIKDTLGPIAIDETVTFPMSDGFKANAAFFKLGFLDKNAVALGRQFKEILSTLWMKAGAYGRCPELSGDVVPNMLLFPNNRFAILTEENTFAEFESAIGQHPEIETVFIITDYEAGYRMMAQRLRVKNTYQLYRDYLDNFRINTDRS